METNLAGATESAQSAVVITPAALLEHWQGHRRLTRRVIDAFPEDRLFEYSIGGMRPFSVMALEMIGMAGPGTQGVATGEWKLVDELAHLSGDPAPATKAEILARWDEMTALIDRLWPQIPATRFQEVDRAFGQYEMPVFGIVLYFIDNEIHHRGQGYVYLRSLGIEPPPFWERS